MRWKDHRKTITFLAALRHDRIGAPLLLAKATSSSRAISAVSPDRVQPLKAAPVQGRTVARASRGRAAKVADAPLKPDGCNAQPTTLPQHSDGPTKITLRIGHEKFETDFKIPIAVVHGSALKNVAADRPPR